MKKSEYVDLFLELAKPDDEGFSRKVPITEFVGKYEKLNLGNGGSWCRNESALGKKYNVVRHKLIKKNAISHVELQGFNKNPSQHQISQQVRKALSGKRCVVLGTTDVEIDHKDGRYDNPAISDVKNQNPDHFQPLSKSANYAKRQHCKTCKKTDQRFDAKLLGYSVSQVKGNGKYRGTCVGCYWYDPFKFNSSLDKSPS